MHHKDAEHERDFAMTHLRPPIVLGGVALLLAALAVPLLAGPKDCHVCPQCASKVCVPIPEKGKENRYCWKVEYKDICIPKFRWPWQMCCAPECGKVRTVKVLKKVEYECEHCGYQWEIKTVGCSSSACADSGR